MLGIEQDWNMESGESARHIVVVACLVRNHNEDVLLIRHRKRGWELPQGRVEEGESLLTALRREVKEEAGIEITSSTLAAVWSLVTPPTAVIFTFVARYAHGSCKGSGDSLEARWVTVDEAKVMVSNPVMRDRLHTVLDHDGEVTFHAYRLSPYSICS